MKNKVKYLRSDNAGKHQTKLPDLCNKLVIQLEYTAPYTPQHNGAVERKFVTDRDRGNAMLNASNLRYCVQLRLWVEAVNTATKIGNISIFPGET
jgi:transposase InsO family protein